MLTRQNKYHHRLVVPWSHLNLRHVNDLLRGRHFLFYVWSEYCSGFRVFCSEFLRTGKYREGASEWGGPRKKFLNTPICPLTRPLFATIFEADRGVKEKFSKGGGSGGTLTLFSGSQKLRTKNPKPTAKLTPNKTRI